MTCDILLFLCVPSESMQPRAIPGCLSQRLAGASPLRWQKERLEHALIVSIFSLLYVRILISKSGLICRKVCSGAVASLPQKTPAQPECPPFSLLFCLVITNMMVIKEYVSSKARAFSQETQTVTQILKIAVSHQWHSTNHPSHLWFLIICVVVVVVVVVPLGKSVVIK